MKTTKFEQDSTPVILCNFQPSEVKTVKLKTKHSGLEKYNSATATGFDDLPRNSKNFFFGNDSANTFNDVLAGRSNITKPANKGTRITNKTRRRKAYSEFDGVLDIDRYIDGANDIYTRKTRRRGTPKMSLYIHISAASKVNGAKIKKFLVAIVKEVYQYIARGNQVSIYIVSASSNIGTRKKCKVLTVTQLKKSHKPLDFQKLASIAKTCYYRYFILKATMLAAEEHGYKNTPTIGTPTDGATAYDLTKSYAMSREPFIFYDFSHFERTGTLAYQKTI